jgi:bifunctional non-homologous end joining protein LigD
MSDRMTFGRYVVEISNPDRILFPDDGVTKGDVLKFYEAIGPTLLRHVRGRPVSMHRYPSGIESAGFYQKQAGEYFPNWFKTVRIEKEDGFVDHPLLTNVAGIVYLAQLGSITPHVWLSRDDDVHRPDQVVFDLDPSDDATDFEPVRRAALILREVLEREGMQPFVMVTGSSGVHVRTPIRRGPDFDVVKQWARDVAGMAVEAAPELLTVEVRKNKREGRIFVDILRNAYAQTAVPPYALRARPGAPVSMPVTWEELASTVTSARYFDIHTALDRISDIGDIWKSMYRHSRTLPTMD